MARFDPVDPRVRLAIAQWPPDAPRGAVSTFYLAVTSLDPTGRGRKRWSNRWKGALNAFDITFDGRLSAGRN